MSGQAVVIGAGIAGLLAAKALAPHFASVTIVEADIPQRDAPDIRKAIPQGAHIHALLKSGEAAMSALCPGFRRRLRDAGGHAFPFRSRWRAYTAKGWAEPIDTGLTMLAQSRPMLEWVLRRETLATAGIGILPARVRGLRVAPDGAAAGVLLAPDARPLEANLVVDASGRGGKTLDWLASAGCPPPPQDRMKPEIRYTSALFSRSIASGPDFGGWLMFPQPPETRGAVLVPVENDRWIATAFDRFGAQVPADDAGFMGFLADLPDPKFATLLRGEAPAGAFRSYRISEVYLRRFDRIADDLPARYLPIGDAIATYNPTFAQGMSVAALQAQALGQALQQAGPADAAGLARRYLPRAIEPAEWAWRLGQAMDFGYDRVEGTRTAQTRRFAALLTRVLVRTASDPEVMNRWARIAHLLETPDNIEDLLHGVRESPPHPADDAGAP